MYIIYYITCTILYYTIQFCIIILYKNLHLRLLIIIIINFHVKYFAIVYHTIYTYFK